MELKSKAMAMLGMATALMGGTDTASRGLSEEGQMLRMSKEDRLNYDRVRLSRQTAGFDYKKRNKKRRESSRMRAKNRKS